MSTISPKPLTKERRAEIDIIIRDAADRIGPVFFEMPLCGAIGALLADSQFWREAIKNAPMLDVAQGFVEETEARCPWCGSTADIHSKYQVDHEPDCPWELAQE